MRGEIRSSDVRHCPAHPRSPMANEDLSKAGKATASLLAKAVACFVAGAAVSRLLVPDQMAKDVAELKTNMSRVMDRLGIEAEAKLPAIRNPGAAR